MHGRDPALAALPGAQQDLKTAIASGLEAARARTNAVLEPVGAEDLVRQHSPLMSPLVWDLAHIGHFEELWIIREVGGRPPLEEEHDDVYDAFRHARDERPTLDMLEPDAARAYIEAVRERALEVLEEVELDADDPLLRDGFVFGLVVQHEQQHNETMLATLQLREEPPYQFSEPPPPPAQAPAREEVLVEAGAFVMGTDIEPWAYDNERSAHECGLPAFWIDTVPVSNRAYLDFVEAGGYDDPRWWKAEGWAWRQEAGLEHPQFWRREGERSWSRLRFGRREALPSDEPVQHVCWYEADAYARWAGKRLPSEAEWERAASWEAGGGKRRYPWGDGDPTAEQANLAQGRFGPSPVGAYPAGSSPCGCLQLMGDVWEWTSSDFGPYPGFRAFPYREYSEVFFGSEYKVLRGGSWATDPVAVRTTFRNWDYPIRRQIFAGFRCARDA